MRFTSGLALFGLCFQWQICSCSNLKTSFSSCGLATLFVHLLWSMKWRCVCRMSVACSKSTLAAVLFRYAKEPQDYGCNFLFLHYWRAHSLCWLSPMTALLCILSSRRPELGFCALIFAFCLLHWSRASQLCFVFLMHVFLVQQHCFFACSFYFLTLLFELTLIKVTYNHEIKIALVLFIKNKTTNKLASISSRLIWEFDV